MNRRLKPPRAGVSGPTRCVLVGTVLSICLSFWACAQELDRVDSRRDVVLIVIDTLRADFVGISGHAPHPATPEIDRLARRGRWFGETLAGAPWTPPSVRSLMTSLEPPVHGLHLEGDRLAGGGPDLPPGASTLAEVFASAGYRTMAVTAGGGVGSALGFDRGFERFYEPEDRPETDIEAGVDRTLEWLAEPDPRPTFFFLHTYEVHLPNTHEAFDSEDDPAAAAAAAYAGDLAVADHHLGRLFDALESDGRLANSVIVVTSDHGENLHDRAIGGRMVDHGHHLHNELLRVPLIMVAPGLIPPNGEITGSATLLDVLPTVCSLLGIGLEGVPHQGRDLSPALLGSDPVEAGRAFFAWAPLQGPSWGAIRTDRWALLHSPPIETDQWWGEVRVPVIALFDRSEDPGERTNLADDHPEMVASMLKELAERKRHDLEFRGRLGGSRTMAPDTTEALRELGYLDRESSQE